MPRKSMTTLMLALPILSALALTGCERQAPTKTEYGMGEKIDLGPFSYVVVETAWHSQLGEGFQLRSPQNRFLLLTLSITNRGTTDAAVPQFVLQGPGGQEIKELEDGTGVSNWLGFLRNVGPSQNLQGRVLFDAPLSSFKLRLSDSSETGYEKNVWVDIPLRIDSNDVQAPLPDIGQ